MDIKDVENLAQLARIELTEEEKKEFLSDMDSILSYVKQIEEMKIETTGEPCVFTQGSPVVVNVWIEDEIKVQEFSKEVITKQFPDAQDGFLKVKKIL